jgi:hypothetical protein
LEDDLEKNVNDGWIKLMKYDSYSARSYMTHVYEPSESFLQSHPGFPEAHLPTVVVNWMESLDKTTGWYDRALTTTILEEMAFGFTTRENADPVKFWCLE